MAPKPDVDDDDTKTFLLALHFRRLELSTFSRRRRKLLNDNYNSFSSSTKATRRWDNFIEKMRCFSCCAALWKRRQVKRGFFCGGFRRIFSWAVRAADPIGRLSKLRHESTLMMQCPKSLVTLLLRVPTYESLERVHWTRKLIKISSLTHDREGNRMTKRLASIPFDSIERNGIKL